MNSDSLLWSQVTPVILTYNEESNIERLLTSLVLFKHVVVVDSLSTDNTENIVKKFSNATFVQREFDVLATQWNFAIGLKEITTDWILALDADYFIDEDGFDEITEKLNINFQDSQYKCFESSFVYCIDGVPIKGSIYPNVTILFDKLVSSFIQDGHAHRVKVEGNIGLLNCRILHDDRKSFQSWINSQVKYAKLEAIKLTSKKKVGFKDRIRLFGLAPWILPLYILFIKGGILSGRYGLRYAAERAIAEWLLIIFIIKQKSIDKNYKN